MAKKNLSSLMSGLMGQPEMTEENNVAQENVATIKSEKSESEKTEGKRKPGRPRNVSSEVRATFIVDPDILRKIKYITLVEGNLQKDVIDAALRQYIRKWETANGTITIPNKK